MQWVVIIGIGLIWLIATIYNSITDSINDSKKQSELRKKRDEKYGNRTINKSLSLYDRNRDIIDRVAAKITSGYQGRFYMDDLVKSCLNEIALAEGQTQKAPNNSYLYVWEPSASTDWRMLSKSIRTFFESAKQEIELKDRERLNELRKIENEMQKVKNVLVAKSRALVNPLDIQKIIYIDDEPATINIDIIKSVLTPNRVPWSEKEKGILEYDGSYDEFPHFDGPNELKEVKELNLAIHKYNEQQKEHVVLHEQNKQFFIKIFDGYKKGKSTAVVDRTNHILNNITFPETVPKIWQMTFDEAEKIAIIEVKLPDVVHAKIVKDVELKSGSTEKPLNKKELHEQVPSIHPAIILRIAFEVFRSDFNDSISLLVINGWVEYDDPATGKRKKTYTSSIALKKEQVVDMNLAKVEPLTAFTSMKGKSAGKLVEIIPIVPVISMNREDKRFIETKKVLNELDAASNLASMDWQDFENLIAELFEKEFQKEGVEVKVTQASRDRGVDAVIFDPDPIKGGKFVVQAKRYTNTVDVSAVRDLCAVVKKEGASRGILVTTSSYGADAYEFAKNEPVSLLNGSELLGLLQKHGYVFRIDLKEARKLNIANS